MRDTWGRTIDYLRISLTDRCNLRCRYCMPSDVPSVSHDDILRYEEILEICEAAVSLGINRFKVTGENRSCARAPFLLYPGSRRFRESVM